MLLQSFSSGWRQEISRERDRILSEHAAGTEGAEAFLGPINFQVAISSNCGSASVLAVYAWEIRVRINGVLKSTSVPKQRHFRYKRIFGVWIDVSGRF
jgi:hypothetical protein